MRPSRREELIRRIEIDKAFAARKKEAQFSYGAYEKQKVFHKLGTEYRERCLMAGNQLGKSYAGANEVYYHLSGNYPDWWKGLRFDEPVTVWIGGDTGETIRDTTQRLLLDRPGRLDTPDEYSGIIPLRLMVDKPKPAMGVANLLDHFKVKHKSGGTSYAYFKAYAKGRQKWQGETVDFVWFDEEPPRDIYSEGLTRTNNGQQGQRAMLTFTPLLGMSQVVTEFLLKPTNEQVVVNYTIEECEHYSDEEKASIIASYPEHERDARAKGTPIMGSGRIFPIKDSEIEEEPLNLADVPDWWKQIAGIDFGWDHPSAAVRLLYDPENDVIHVHAEHRKRKQTPLMFAAGIKPWGNIPVAWPHDGLQHDKGSGATLADQYRDAGLNMLDDKATFEGGGNGVEAGLSEMLDRMQTGRWKVSRLLEYWFQEFRIYHRKNGKVVKEKDDLMAASRYAMMMLRFAEPPRSNYTYVPREPSSWRS